MNRTHLLVTTAPVAALAYATAPAANDEPTALIEASVLEKRSTDSIFMLSYWDKVDSIMDGIDGMKLRCDDFLPRFRDEDSEDYAFRLKQTKMTNVYSDIVEGLAAKPFEQAVQLIEDETDTTIDSAPNSSIPTEINDFIWDVDGSGNNISGFAAHTFLQGINNAIDWIMVDHDKRDPTVISMADARARGLRPYWSHILARNVLDVQSRMIGAKEVLTYVKIFEPGDVDHIREFTRIETISNGVRSHEVIWNLYAKVSGGTNNAYHIEETGTVSIGVIPLVPFVTGRREGRRWRFFPPMRAAAELQVELFQQESGLKYASTLTAYPMLAANGISVPKDKAGKPDYKLAVGPNRVLWAEANNDGTVGSWAYVEPGSESLKFLESRIENTIQQLRELGRQPLTASSSNITIITAAVAAGKAKSAVKAWALVLKNSLEEALLLTAMWMGVNYDPTVHVFAEFDDWMEGDDLASLDADRDRGDISQETLWEEKQRRGVYSSNFTAARERQRLLNDVPSGPDVTGGPLTVNPPAR